VTAEERRLRALGREEDEPSPSRDAHHALENALFEIKRVIVGQEAMLERVLVALLAGGHVLLEGVPGLGKTMLVRTIADVIDCTFNRVQFTPDLMPADITGTNILIEEAGARVFRFQPGPIFANLVLADEINRATPKTQSSLLEAMQEHQVTVARQRYKLEPPFFVLATQNPLEMEGTYPLPEAQLDRFLFKQVLAYPSREEERAIVAAYGMRAGAADPAELGVQPVAGAVALAAANAAVAGVRLTDEIVGYVLDLVRSTRETPDLQSGASPRCASQLALAARARAALDGRDYALPDDVKALALPMLRHRVILSPAAEIEGRRAETIIAGLVDRAAAPR